MHDGPSTGDTSDSASVRARDQRWLNDVYRGDVPQLTVRVVLAGFLLGGLLSITNLYVGAKTGATLGVAITSAILAYALFAALHRVGWGTRLHVLENTQLQSIACAAGYMTSPLTASMAAYMMLTGTVVPWWQMMAWLMGLALLGVLCAFPLKRLFINDQQLPFPEGQACGILMSSLDRGTAGATDDGPARSARLLLGSFVVAGVVQLLQAESLLTRLRLGFLKIPHYLDAWYYRLADRYEWWTPSVAGVSWREFTLRPTLDVAMLGLGGLMGIRTCSSLLVGAVVNYCFLAPWMVARGDIVPVDGAVGFGRITAWSLWCGVALMTTASLWSLFSQRTAVHRIWQQIASHRSSAADDPLVAIELPVRLSLIGIPVVGAGMIALGYGCFGIPVWVGLLALPLVFLCAWIGVTVTGQTSITPTGALGKVTQLTYGVVAPRDITTNVAAAGLSAEVALQSASMIQNMKPGYMLGAKPRLQAVGHLIGAVSGSIASVAVFYPIFLRGNPSQLVSDTFPFPAASVWKAVAELLTRGLSALPTSALVAAVTAAVLGIGMQILLDRRAPWALSPVAMGLAFVIPFHICLSLFLGAFVFWCLDRPGEPHRWWRVAVEHRGAICAGLIAGAALMGVFLSALEVWLPPGP